MTCNWARRGNRQFRYLNKEGENLGKEKSLLILSSFPERASLVAQLVKNPPAMQEIPVQFLGWEDPLEKGKATFSSILA